jgi:hypothetical protein
MMVRSSDLRGQRPLSRPLGHGTLPNARRAKGVRAELPGSAPQFGLGIMVDRVEDSRAPG